MKLKSFLIAIILLIACNGWAATYYVRTDGHDTSCNGTADASSASAPNCAWQTIQKAATTLNGVQTVIVGDGTYNERVQIANSGTDADNLLTFKAKNKWLAIVEKDTQGFNITGNYIKIDGFKVQGFIFGSQYAAIKVSGSNNVITNIYSNQNQYISMQVTGNYNIISNNYILKPQFGLVIGGTGNLIENNEVDQLENYWVGVDTDYLRYFGSDHIFRGNNFHGADVARLTAAGSHIDCFQTFEQGGNPASFNILIEQNYCSDCAEGVMPSATVTYKSDGLTVRNNVFADFTSYGVVPYGIKNVKVYNNTFIANKGYYGVQCYDYSTCEIQNNIFYDITAGATRAYGIDGTSSWVTDAGKNNLLYSQYQSYSAVNFPNDVINQNPLFVSSSDYHLLSGSPAKDAGITIAGFSTDKDGTTRPQGSAWDIGAYEYTLDGGATIVNTGAVFSGCTF